MVLVFCCFSNQTHPDIIGKNKYTNRRRKPKVVLRKCTLVAVSPDQGHDIVDVNIQPSEIHSVLTRVFWFFPQASTKGTASRSTISQRITTTTPTAQSTSCVSLKQPPPLLALISLPPQKEILYGQGADQKIITPPLLNVRC